jgi:transcriptional regulator with XRE-family HTH domain
MARARLARNLTQAGLAEQAGVSKRTLERLESGEVAMQLSGFVRVCRALGLAGRLESFIPETVPSPIAQLKMQGRTRQRASGQRAEPKLARKTTSKTAAMNQPKNRLPWTWGEP